MTQDTTRSAAKPQRFGWLRPPKGSEDGTMSLVDHLKELRYRVTLGALSIVVAAIVSALFYSELVRVIVRPYEQARDMIVASNPEAEVRLVTDGPISPFTLAIIACAVGGILLASPIWMYQIWAFIAPGLLKNEKKYALAFIGSAVPLFLAGCYVGYWVLPKGIAVMLGFTPKGLEISNLLEMGRFLSFELRIIAVFGLSFLLPVIVVTLNLLNVVRGYQLGKARKIVIFVSFVFAAAATPSVDPFSMLALCIPMTVLYLVAELICRQLDKRKGIEVEVEQEFAIDVDDGK